MSLQCNLSLNVLSVPAGQPAYGNLQVYNPNAVAVVVTGVALKFIAQGDALPGHTSAPMPTLAIGQGQTVSVPALSSINIGPFQVVVPSSASQNAFQSMYPIGVSTPVNAQPAQPAPVTFVIGCDVMASDGSTNAAGTVALIVSPSVSSPAGMQGGYLNQSTGTNFVTFLAVM